MHYSGVIAEALYSGDLYDRAAEDMLQAEKLIKIYVLSESDVLDCWLEAHQDIKDNWDLIMEMAKKLYQKKILGTEYFDELLLKS